jgi:polyadenylate-binding protein
MQHLGVDTGLVQFWNEDDARQAEEAMHCADVQNQNIAVQVYQPRRTASGGHGEFNPSAPSFVPSGSIYYPTPAQASQVCPSH